MKRITIMAVTVLMILLSVFGTPATAESTYTLKLGQTEISIAAEDNAICSFTPSKSGTYTFYSTLPENSDNDPRAYLYDSSDDELGFSDDAAGMGSNFSITASLSAGKTYYLVVDYYWDDNSGICYINVEEEYAYAPKTDFEVKPGKTVTMQVKGRCTVDPTATFTWYKKAYDFTTLTYKTTKLKNAKSSYKITNCQKSGHYICVVNEGKENEQSFGYSVTVKNNFRITPKGNSVYFYYGKGKVKLQVTPSGNDVTNVKYYWFKVDDDAPSFAEAYQFIKTTTSPSLSVTPAGPGEEIYMCIGVDKYNNEDSTSFFVASVSDVILVNEYKDVVNTSTTDSYLKIFLFAPEQDGTYQVSTTGEGTPGVYVYDEAVNTLGYSYNEVNASFDVELNKGMVYYLLVSLKPDRAIQVNITGAAGTTILSAGNVAAGINLGWPLDEATEQFKLFKRKKGASSWTALTTQTGNLYEDTSSMKMGDVYEYYLKTYDGSSWSEDGPVTEITRNPFYDVSVNADYFGAVAWAKNSGVVNGIDSTHFGPTDPVQRQHFAIMLWRFAGQPKGSTTNPFVDIGSCNATAKKAILWSSGKGIIKGYKDKTFKPKDYVTREQILIMLHRFAGSPKVTEAQIENLYSTCSDNFAEMELGQASVNAMAWALAKGVYEPDPNDEGYVFIRPKDDCSRAELCVFLQNFNTKIKKYK